ncbi:MAG: HDOD domain-containing protein [Oxalobacteraceae bacterium]
MPDENFIIRDPLLDPKQNVIGYGLCRPTQDLENCLSEDRITAFVGSIAAAFNDSEDGWLLAESLIFLDVPPNVLSLNALSLLPPKNTVFGVTVTDLHDQKSLLKIAALRERGFGISLRDANLVLHDKSLLAHLTYVEIDFSSTDFTTQAKVYGSFKQSSIKMLARQVTDWQAFDVCASLGLDTFVGKLHLTPRSVSQSRGLNPSQTVILRLMQMVRANADIQQLEDVLKRDAAVTYKLLRYINSAGQGQRREIQSLKQALQLLGYNPLYRWLSLLLATSTTNGFSPVLLEAALVRGRLTEILGQNILSKADAENLFVVGMFSLLDRVLGISMDEVLAKIQVSEAISNALLSRTGMYGPFLALAEACELNANLVAALALPYRLSAADINHYHLSALAWVKNLPA